MQKWPTQRRRDRPKILSLIKSKNWKPPLPMSATLERPARGRPGCSPRGWHGRPKKSPTAAVHRCEPHHSRFQPGECRRLAPSEPRSRVLRQCHQQFAYCWMKAVTGRYDLVVGQPCWVKAAGGAGRTPGLVVQPAAVAGTRDLAHPRRRGRALYERRSACGQLGKKPTGGHWNSGIAVLRNNGLIETDEGSAQRSRRYRAAPLLRG